MLKLIGKSIPCQIFDDEASNEQSGTVVFDHRSFKLSAQGTSKSYLKEEVTIEELGGDSCRVSFVSSDLYFVIEYPQISRILKSQNYPGRYKLRCNKSFFRLLALTLCGLFCCALFYKALTPISHWVAHQISYEDERRFFGGEIRKSFESHFCYNSKALSSLEELKRRLLGPSEDKKLQNHIKISIVNWNGERAFALPGGFVFVTRDLMERPKEQIATVIAREIGHIKQKHALGDYLRRHSISIALNILIGTSRVGAEMDSNFTFNRFSEELEAEADQEALLLLDKSGFDHLPMATFLYSLTKVTQKNFTEEAIKPLSAHPLSLSRITHIKNYQRHVPISPAQWDFPWHRLEGSECF